MPTTPTTYSDRARPGTDPGFGFGGGQVERRRRKDRGAEGAERIWGWGIMVWGAGVPQKFFSSLGLKMRILVRSPAHL